MVEGAVRFFGREDGDPAALKGERLAVLGYGHLGRSAALNLRDSGVGSLVVGNIADEYAEQARAEGFRVLPIGQAVAASTVVLVLLPDEIIPEVFAAEIAPGLQDGAALLFASGYTLAYGLVAPPAGVDVLLLAPRMGGEQARARFVAGEGYFAYVSAEQDATGRAWPRLLGVAAALGVLRAGALELDARREADLDLFVEQSMGAVIGMAIMTAFTLGVDAGLPPEALVMEMYMSGEMETVFRAFRQEGFFRASELHGPTALFGGFLRTMDLLMQSDLTQRFGDILAEIQRGEFARRFQAEREAGYPTLSEVQTLISEQGPMAQPLAGAEAQVRAMLNGQEKRA
jgi:ketol-acid reductoisomerase